MRTILLAEETPELRHALSLMLEERGHRVHAFSNGAKAWGHLISTPPDLLVISRELPGLGGLDLLALVNGAGLKIPTVFMTAAGSEAIAADAVNLGAACYLIKGPAEEMRRPLEKALKRACHELDLERENERLIEELRGQNDALEAEVASRTADLRQAYEDLQSLDRMKSEFITLMGHEIRTPLTSILGFSELIRRDLCDDPTELKCVAEQIRDAGKRLCHFVDDVMELFRWLSGTEVLAEDRVRLDRVVRSAQDLVAEKGMAKDITFTVTSSGETEICGDEFALVKAVGRILDNAVKFSPHEGSIEVTVGRKADLGVLEVMDHGQGIDPERKDAIFRPLEIAGKIEHHSQGRGLGLALVQAVVAGHGGEIDVDSAGIGHGTTVRVEFPIARATPDSETSEAALLRKGA